MSRLPGPRTPVALVRTGIRVMRNQRDLLWLYERYGPISGFGVGPFRFVYLLGPEANEFILSSGHDKFEWREAFKGLIPVEGDTALVVSDLELLTTDPKPTGLASMYPKDGLRVRARVASSVSTPRI